MRIVFLILSLIVGFQVHAACPSDRAQILKERLQSLETEMKPLRDLNKDAIVRGDEVLRKIQELETSPGATAIQNADIVQEVNRNANAMSSTQLNLVQEKVEVIRASIGLELPDNNQMMLTAAVKEAINQGIIAINLKVKPTSSLSDTLQSKARERFTHMKANQQFVQGSFEMLEKTRLELETKCLKGEATFEAIVARNKFNFSNCIATKADEPESEKWGGKIAADSCRHVIACGEVKGPQGQPIGSSSHRWLIDCKKRNNSCLEVAACASQAQGADGKIRSVSPGSAR